MRADDRSWPTPRRAPSGSCGLGGARWPLRRLSSIWASRPLRRWDVLLVSVASLGVRRRRALVRRCPGEAVPAGSHSGSGRSRCCVFAILVVASESLRVLLVGLALAALAVGSARVALPMDAPDPRWTSRPAPRPNHPVLLMNLRSGGGKAERFQLVERCRERGIEPVVLTPGVDLRELAEDAVRRGADVIGMAGGDGSQALVASVASQHGMPFVVVPAGTRNHFALDLGVDREDVVGALDAFEDGVDRVIDLAEVNGRVFVNNASMGVYAHVVQAPEYRDAKSPDRRIDPARPARPRSHPAGPAIHPPVGRGAADRESPPGVQQSLPVDAAARSGHATSYRPRRARSRVAPSSRRGRCGDALLPCRPPGRSGASRASTSGRPTEFEVRSGAPVEIGVDGEALTLDPPLRFVIRAGGADGADAPVCPGPVASCRAKSRRRSARPCSTCGIQHSDDRSTPA